MEPQSPSSDLTFSMDCVRVNNVILVSNAIAAELFLARVFPHFTECFIVAADGSYPTNQNLKKHVLHELATNPQMAVAIFGADSYQKIPIQTQRILVFDRLIADCFSSAKIKSLFRQSFTEFDIVRMLISFFDQWKIVHRSGNYAYQLRTSTEYERDRMGWLLDLIAPQDKAIEPRTTPYLVENNGNLVFSQKPIPQEEEL